MRPTIVIGTAVTAAALTLLASLIGAVVAGNQVSVNPGVVARGALVVAALAVTAAVWLRRLGPRDRTQTIVAGLWLGWLLNPTTWTGNGFVAQLFTDITVARTLIDLVLWFGVSVGLVALLARTRQA